MEGMIKKYQQRFRKVRTELDRWAELQSCLISQFRNACSIVERLPVLQDSKNFGCLNGVNGIKDALLTRQRESLQNSFVLMEKTLEEFHGIVLSLERIHRDGKQMIKGGSNMTKKQLQLRVGLKPSVAYCLDGLLLLYQMHQSEYLLKKSLVSALSVLTLKPNPGDLLAVQQLLIDQPNIPKEEVEFVFDIVFAEEIS
ncbi:hypothetical protein UlMin_035737 [Ulmus minor]